MNLQIASLIVKAAKGNHTVSSLLSFIKSAFPGTNIEEYRDLAQKEVQKRINKQLSAPVYSGRSIRYQ